MGELTMSDSKDLGLGKQWRRVVSPKGGIINPPVSFAPNEPLSLSIRFSLLYRCKGGPHPLKQ